MSTDTYCMIRLTQYSLHHLAAVFHEADYAHQLSNPDLDDLKAVDAFGVELIKAIDRHPDLSPQDVVQLTFSRGGAGVDVKMPETTVRNFLEACARLNTDDAVKMVRPFVDIHDIARTWSVDYASDRV